MLLILDQSLIEALDNPEQQDYTVNALQEAAQAFMKGSHLIFSHPRVLAELKDNPLLSTPAKKAYARLYERYPQLDSYLNFFNRRLEILGCDEVFEVAELNSYKTCRVSAKLISQTEILSKPILLAENLSDTSFIDKLAHCYLAKSKIGNVRLSYEPRGGGGSTLADEYGQIQNDRNHLCLCIADGDMKHPDSAYGETAQALIRIDLNQGLCETFVLNLQEVENLIPGRILSEIIEGNEQRSQALRNWERLRELDNTSIRFFDLKLGIQLSGIVNQPDSPYSRYWANLLGFMGKIPQCLRLYQCDKDNDCECTILPGFGKNTLENALTKLQNVTAQKLVEIFEPTLCDDLDQIGSILVSCFCSSEPMRV